jgi:hypothetical protein
MSVEDVIPAYDPYKKDRQVREMRDRILAKREAFRRETSPLVPRIAEDDLAACAAYVEALGRRWDFEIVWHPKPIAGATAFAEWKQRRIQVPVIVELEQFAVALHEAGHLLAGDCTRKAPHFVDRGDRDWHACVECETAAWKIALECLAPASCLDVVHQRLRRSLAIYRSKTPATGKALAGLEALSGDIALKRAQAARWRN